MKEQNRWPADSSYDPRQERATRLLVWYSQQARSLPWRLSREPYHIWVSEVMAQQTRIETMLPYYHRFLAAFPTIQALADSPLDQVLALWAGLGYYRRAENMHRTARLLVEQYDGILPDSFDLLKRLPGIGDYMAGAIASIAYNRAYPAVDGNVRRVVARIQGISELLPSPALDRQVTLWVMETMPGGRAGEFNQALMELGALVCLPTKPHCTSCPLGDYCIAHKKKLTDVLPLRKSKASPEVEKITVVLILDAHGRVLMRKRKESLLQGMWEFVVLKDHQDPDDLAQNLVNLGLPALRIYSIGKSRHLFSHRVWQIISYAGTWAGVAVPREYCFKTLSELDRLALPAAFRMQREWLERKIDRDD